MSSLLCLNFWRNVLIVKALDSLNGLASGVCFYKSIGNRLCRSISFSDVITGFRANFILDRCGPIQVPLCSGCADRDLYRIWGFPCSLIYGFSPSPLDNRDSIYYVDRIRCPRWLGRIGTMASEQCRRTAFVMPSHVEGSGIILWKNNDFPWLGINCITDHSIWYWCTDQYIVQRTLAKNLSRWHGAELIWGASFLKVWLVLVFHCLGLLVGRYIKKEFFIFR